MTALETCRSVRYTLEALQRRVEITSLEEIEGLMTRSGAFYPPPGTFDFVIQAAIRPYRDGRGFA